MLCALSALSAASVNMVFDTFVAGSFKSESSFFHCLLGISTCRNCLTILSSLPTGSHKAVVSDVLISLLCSADTLWTHGSGPVSSASSDMVDTSANTGELSMLGMENGCGAECFSRVIRSFLHDHSISFHSERVFDVCLWSLKLTLSPFLFSANLTA